MEKAGAHSARGDAEQASIILEELIELKPDLLRAWEMLIALLTERGDTRTLEEYVKRLESRPRTHAPVLIFARGCLALLHGDKKSARQLLTNAHGADPESVPILEALARLELAEGQTDAAFAHAQRLLNLASDNAWAHCITGLVLLGRGHHSGAEAAFRRSLAIRKIPEALNGLARVLLSRKAYSEAEELAREGLKMSERNASLWDTLGAVLMDTDRLAEAQQAIEKGLEIARQDAGLLLRMAEVHIRKGQWKRVMAIVTALERRSGKLGLEEQKRLGTLATELKERRAS
ncbi:MAG: tetratricopeptide repeat protein [Kiritimatiellia bacterium]